MVGDNRLLLLAVVDCIMGGQKQLS
jgi:hypothetical protein